MKKIKVNKNFVVLVFGVSCAFILTHFITRPWKDYAALLGMIMMAASVWFWDEKELLPKENKA